MASTETFKCVQININGLSDRSQISLDQYVNKIKADLVYLSETKTANDFNLSNYHTLCRPHHNNPNKQGGVALLYRQALQVDRMSMLEDSEVDVLFATCTVGNRNILTCSVYSPPQNQEKLKQVLKCIKAAKCKLKQYNCSDLLVIGDLNARHALWNDCKNNTAGEELDKFISEEDFIVDDSLHHNTFLCENGGSHIDIAMMTPDLHSRMEPQSVDDAVELFTGAPLRGHIPVISTFKVTKPSQTYKVVSDWKNADWTCYQEQLCQLSVNIIPDIQNMRDPCQIWSASHNILVRARDNCIPKKSITCHSKPYWTEELSKLSKELRSIRKKFKHRSTLTNKNLLNRAKEDFTTALKKAKAELLEKQAEELNSSNASPFWKTYRKLYHKREDNSIGSISDGTKIYNTDKEKADKFYDSIFQGAHLNDRHFDEQWKQSVESKLLQPVTVNEKPMNSKIQVEEITDALKRLQGLRKSPDCDGVHPLMLKYAPDMFVIVLYVLFNKVLDYTVWPWTNNKVIFLRKAGKKDYTQTQAYRPITISSYVGKLFERILESRVRLHLEQEQLLPNYQYGFRDNRSTGTYITNMISTIQHRLKSKQETAGIFLDLQKAFDSVWHKGLIFRMLECGLEGKILKIISKFIKTRKVRLQVNNYVTEPRQCPLGLPQGSVLSPLLFILYTRDMLESTAGTRLQFADDCSIISWATTNRDLQKILDQNGEALSAWLNRWRLCANCQKTDVVPFRGTANPPVIQGTQVQLVKHTKVLGVIIESNMSFQMQLDTAKSNATRKWNMLKSHIGAGLSMTACRKILNTVVIPKACYCGHLWDLNSDISLYTFLKDLLRVPYKPPGELLYKLAGVLPLDIRYRYNRLSTLRQLIATTDIETLQNNVKSRLYLSFLTDVKSLCGRKSGFGDLSVNELKRTRLKKHCEEQWHKRWIATTSTLQDDTVLGILPQHYFEKHDAIRKLEVSTPRLVGAALSLVSGHCDLQLHRYKLGLTYSPTCLCLTEDESAAHFVMRCPLYRERRVQSGIMDGELTLDKVIFFIQLTNRLS